MSTSSWTIVSVLLLALGVAFYLWMGVSNGNWTDVGVYSLTIVLVGFGVFGLLATRTGRADAS